MKTKTMSVFEVTYRSADDREHKARVVASHSAWAVTEIYRRKYRLKEFVSVVDQGVVLITEPPRAVREMLLSRIIQIGAIMDAIDEEIANIGVDLERHRETVDRIAAMKERVSKVPRTY